MQIEITDLWKIYQRDICSRNVPLAYDIIENYRTPLVIENKLAPHWKYEGYADTSTITILFDVLCTKESCYIGIIYFYQLVVEY